MKACEHPEFNSEFPEQFNWGYLDSPTLSELAAKFASRINQEMLFLAHQRHATPGLRLALNEIAKVANL